MFLQTSMKVEFPFSALSKPSTKRQQHSAPTSHTVGSQRGISTTFKLRAKRNLLNPNLNLKLNLNLVDFSGYRFTSSSWSTTLNTTRSVGPLTPILLDETDLSDIRGQQRCIRSRIEKGNNSPSPAKETCSRDIGIPKRIAQMASG